MSVSNARHGARALLAAGLLLTLLGSLGTARAATHAVSMSDFAFSPSTLTITAGDTVTWTNDDPVVHTATSTSGAFDSGDLDPGASYSVTFTTAGTYDYLCTPHPTMTGQVVVQAAPAETAAPSGEGPLPDVAMIPETPANWALLVGILLVGAAGLTVIARRPRT